ncbi:MAG: Uma2 family endonuclease [Cyanobacteria bacterium SBLK]|nr:Uma2 family endonuclease [Cyanobacteria bacterium SBLK]
MTTVTSQTSVSSDVKQLSEPLLRLSVEQYHQMIAAGILDKNDRIELLEGLLILKMAKNPPHRAATKLARTSFEAIVPQGWYVDTQEPITLENSEPEPDIAIVRGETRDYLDRHPGSGDVALVMEISDSTLERDRTLKKRLYARAEIPVYWVLNLPERQLEVYTQPNPLGENPTYQQRQDFQESDRVEVAIAGEAIDAIAVRDLLP